MQRRSQEPAQTLKVTETWTKKVLPSVAVSSCVHWTGVTLQAMSVNQRFRLGLVWILGFLFFVVKVVK